MSYDFWPKFWLWLIGTILVLMVIAVVYDAYQTTLWMNANHCQQTMQSRDYTYYMTIQSGNTTILVPQTGKEYLYNCDNNQTIWWYAR